MAGKKIVRKKSGSKSKRRTLKRSPSFFVDEFVSIDQEVVFAGFLLVVSLIALGFSVHVWDWGFAAVRAAGF
jgi:hypothetical protein